MPTLKLYTEDVASQLPPFLAAAIGLGPGSHRQGHVLIVAPSKAAAARLAADRGLSERDFAPRHLRDASLQWIIAVVALDAAGLLDEPGIFVTKKDGRNRAPVVAIDPDGTAREVGRLVSAPGARPGTPPRLERTGPTVDKPAGVPEERAIQDGVQAPIDEMTRRSRELLRVLDSLDGQAAMLRNMAELDGPVSQHARTLADYALRVFEAAVAVDTLRRAADEQRGSATS